MAATSSIACKDDDTNNSGSGGGGGGGGGGAHFMGEQEEDAGALPLRPFPLAGNSSSPSPKRSGGRRSVQKRVVSVPIADGAADGSRGKSCGEGAPPPSDSWAWRKYGQKPIKGSPYPRGYYRCSSSKGCPARKQVERSRVDPNMLVVTYACDHNHPWPLPKNTAAHHQQRPSPPAAMSPPKPSPPAGLISSPAAPSGADVQLEESSSFAADLLGDVDASLVMTMPDEFNWFSDVSTTSSPPAEAFLGSAAMMPMAMEDDDDMEQLGGADAAEDEEYYSLFAGLGELPECAVVFRRVRMQMATPEPPRSVSAASCCGTTG